MNITPTEFSYSYLEDISSLGICYADRLCEYEGKEYNAMDLSVVCAKNTAFREAVYVSLRRLISQGAEKEHALPVLGIYMAEAVIQGVY